MIDFFIMYEGAWQEQTKLSICPQLSVLQDIQEQSAIYVKSVFNFTLIFKGVIYTRKILP